ncbi:uncharacterized protein LOC131189057 [Ahaetulla prasina]|uniref:uncharacterized protein LOC131189057 n=1 Tax=Ahaetulla prasina TaxID=499056 RepID=UPI002649D075|nr:uncharacterized protein LOC131189057 [Ahaetulla prasina]
MPSAVPGLRACSMSFLQFPSFRGSSERYWRRGQSPPSGPALAQASLVCGLGQPLSVSPLEDSQGQDLPQPGGCGPSRASLAPADHLALERSLLRRDKLSGKVIQTTQASRRPSTNRIYDANWSAFCQWCSLGHIDPLGASIPEVLDFLQTGLDRGLSPNTHRRQVAALATVLTCENQKPVKHHPRIRSFLKGATNLRPPVVHRYPTWNLALVLQALTSAPFEPLKTSSLRYLTFKVMFFMAITSARRISELAALSVHEDLCIFHTDRMVLCLDPSFLPKVNFWFHRAQGIILPNFCPGPHHPIEERWHTLDVRRALRRYIKRTASFQRSESLFVSFQPSAMGRKVMSFTIGLWLKACIAKAYEIQACPVPRWIIAHSTRSVATTVAWPTQAPTEDICRAADLVISVAIYQTL